MTIKRDECYDFLIYFITLKKLKYITYNGAIYC